jgi:hypothetical protein
MGAEHQDPLSIVAALKGAHARTEVTTSLLTGVQYLKLVSDVATGHTRFVWLDRPVVALPAEKIAICRQAYHGHVRYFSARLQKEKIATEAPLETQVSRLLFAVGRHLGRPVTALVRSRARGIEVTVSERLPIAEFRLALLLSREIIRSGRTTTFVLSPKLASTFCAQLELLGCSLETQQ